MRGNKSKPRWQHVPNPTEVGMLIRTRRLKLKMTQELVAEKIGITGPQYSRIERGTASLSLEAALILSRILGFTFFDLEIAIEQDSLNKQKRN